MGSISPKGNKVVVSFSVPEIMERSVRLAYPDGPSAKHWVARMSEMIVHAAALILYEKAPQYWKEYQMTKIEGNGHVIVTFYEMEDPDFPV